MALTKEELNNMTNREKAICFIMDFFQYDKMKQEPKISKEDAALLKKDLEKNAKKELIRLASYHEMFNGYTGSDFGIFYSHFRIARAHLLTLAHLLDKEAEEARNLTTILKDLSAHKEACDLTKNTIESFNNIYADYKVEGEEVRAYIKKEELNIDFTIKFYTNALVVLKSFIEALEDFCKVEQITEIIPSFMLKYIEEVKLDYLDLIKIKDQSTKEELSILPKYEEVEISKDIYNKYKKEFLKF